MGRWGEDSGFELLLSILILMIRSRIFGSAEPSHIIGGQLIVGDGSCVLTAGRDIVPNISRERTPLTGLRTDNQLL